MNVFSEATVSRAVGRKCFLSAYIGVITWEEGSPVLVKLVGECEFVLFSVKALSYAGSDSLWCIHVDQGRETGNIRYLTRGIGGTETPTPEVTTAVLCNVYRQNRWDAHRRDVRVWIGPLIR